MSGADLILWRVLELAPAKICSERALSHARRAVTGAPKGNRNAFKHGRYAAEAVADRCKMAALIRVMKSLARAAIED